MRLLNYFKKFFLSKTDIDKFSVITIFAVFALEICFLFSGLFNVTSAIFHVLVILLFLWILLRIINYIVSFVHLKHLGNSFKQSFFDVVSPKEFVAYCFVIAIIIISLINIFISMQTFIFSLAFFEKFNLTMFALILIALFYSSKIDKLTIQIVSLIALFISMYALFSYLIGLSNVYSVVEVDYAQGRYLTMNFSNANGCGGFMCVLASIMLYGIFIYRKILVKIIFAIFASTNLVFMYLSGSRSSIMAMIMFVVFAIILIFAYRKSKINSVLILFLLLLPFIFAASYIVFVNIISNIPAFQEIIDSYSAKNIMSRYYIWVHSFNEIKHSPFFGNYFYLYVSGYYNLHNYILDFMAFFGMIPTIITILFLFFIILSFGKPSIYSTKSQLFAISLFFIPIFEGTGEVETLYYGLAMSVILYISLIFVKYPFGRNSVMENDALLFNINASKIDKSKDRILNVYRDKTVSDNVLSSSFSLIGNVQQYGLSLNPLETQKINIGHINFQHVPSFVKKIELMLEIKRLIRFIKPKSIYIEDEIFAIIEKNKISKYLNKKEITLITY
jgi:O-antigen ligase